MFKRLTYRAGLAAGAALMFAIPAVAQQPVAYDGYVAPRIHGDKPDLGGAWSNVSLTRLTRSSEYDGRLVMTQQEVAELEGDAVATLVERNAPTNPNAGAEEEIPERCSGPGGRDCGYDAGWKDETTKVMRVGGEPRTSFLIYPEDGRLPDRVANEGGGRRGPGGPGGSRTDNPESMGLGDRCLISFGNNAGPPMLPNGYYNNNIKIVQGDDAVAILVEMIHDVRIVRLNAEHRTDGVDPFFGDSIGWYEGDTLVVETTGFEPRTSVQGANSAQTRVTERFTRVADDRLHYAFTVEDPTVWVEPWTGEYEFQGGMGEVYEYACHEGNYGLENMLGGARFDEQEAARAGEPVASR